VFGVSEVAEARRLRALEIFRHAAAAEPAQHSGNARVGVDDDERLAVARQNACMRSVTMRQSLMSIRRKCQTVSCVAFLTSTRQQ
jgi:hypothetical protein